MLDCDSSVTKISILGRIAVVRRAYVDAAYSYRPSSLVYRSLCRSVCHNSEPCKNDKNQTKRLMKKTKNKSRDAQKKRTSHKAAESVLWPEGSLWWGRFAKRVGLEPGVKESGSYGW